MSIAGETPTVVVRSSTGGETHGREGPQVADRGQTVVLDRAMEDDELACSTIMLMLEWGGRIKGSPTSSARRARCRPPKTGPRVATSALRYRGGRA
jgi:hypothetical protein